MKNTNKFNIGDQVVHRDGENDFHIYEIIQPRYPKTLITIRKAIDTGWGITKLESEYRLATEKDILKYKIKNIFIK
jgi:hypothetical protein